MDSINIIFQTIISNEMSALKCHSSVGFNSQEILHEANLCFSVGNYFKQKKLDIECRSVEFCQKDKSYRFSLGSQSGTNETLKPVYAGMLEDLLKDLHVIHVEFYN